MNNFDKVYNSILREGKADPANKKGTKESAPFQKHRNKLESRASSKASRRRGKREMVEEMFPLAGALMRGAAMGLASGAVQNAMDDDEDAENVADYRERFVGLHSGIQELMAEIDELRDQYDSETIDMVLEKLEVLSGDY